MTYYQYSDNLNRLIKKKVTTVTTERDADGRIVASKEVTVTEEYTYPHPVTPLGTRYADGGRVVSYDPKEYDPIKVGVWNGQT